MTLLRSCGVGMIICGCLSAIFVAQTVCNLAASISVTRPHIICACTCHFCMFVLGNQQFWILVEIFWVSEFVLDMIMTTYVLASSIRPTSFPAIQQRSQTSEPALHRQLPCSANSQMTQTAPVALLATTSYEHEMHLQADPTQLNCKARGLTISTPFHASSHPVDIGSHEQVARCRVSRVEVLELGI